MGFINNLGKGFIRSAVNQVGRDAGRVVSNNMYGNAHATPYRNASRNQQQQIYEEDVLIKYADQAPISWLEIIVRIIIAAFFTLIGGIVLIIYGYNKLKKAGLKKATQYVHIPIYREGTFGENREIINYVVRKVGKKEVQANEEEEIRNIKEAKAYLYSGIAIVAIYIVVFVSLNYQSF